MTRFNRLILFLLTGALTAWLLPWGFHFITSRPASYPFTLYSCITHSFASTSRADNEKVFYDSRGERFTERQFDSILPTFLYRQLVADGRLPETIEGIPVEAKDFYRENFMFRSTTPTIRTVPPSLYSLLESLPGRVNLEMPEDVFRINHRMEFIDMATNSILEEKSLLFTKTLTAKGFEFPARHIAGNPTTRKDYDEGYFITDQKYQLFHIKRIRNRPFVRQVDIPAHIRPAYIFPTEYPGRHTYCFLTDTAHRLYSLQTGTYDLKEIPIGTFDPEKENITIFGNAFYWTLQITGSEAPARLYAFNPRDYSLTDSLTQHPIAEDRRLEEAAQYLFPFELTFTSYADKLVYPRISDFSAWALILNLILAMGYLIICRKNLPQCLKGAITLCILGLFAIIPLLFQRKL